MTAGRPRLVAVKTVGALGRVVIPAAVRRATGLEPGARVGIYAGGGGVVLRAVGGTGNCPLCGRPARRARRPSDW
jgi:AbrB family looped-hinge helix DNA binding protein